MKIKAALLVGCSTIAAFAQCDISLKLDAFSACQNRQIEVGQRTQALQQQANQLQQQTTALEAIEQQLTEANRLSRAQAQQAIQQQQQRAQQAVWQSLAATQERDRIENETNRQATMALRADPRIQAALWQAHQRRLEEKRAKKWQKEYLKQQKLEAKRKATKQISPN